MKALLDTHKHHSLPGPLQFTDNPAQKPRQLNAKGCSGSISNVIQRGTQSPPLIGGISCTIEYRLINLHGCSRLLVFICCFNEGIVSGGWKVFAGANDEVRNFREQISANIFVPPPIVAGGFQSLEVIQPTNDALNLPSKGSEPTKPFIPLAISESQAASNSTADNGSGKTNKLVVRQQSKDGDKNLVDRLWHALWVFLAHMIFACVVSFVVTTIGLRLIGR